ncbi:MAG TPA: lmo0937 family membrane protein [Thermoanaerobaculia bacterium]|nr:lmo0937 family membrane protein [Thermoanaerobaculia bacterium]
MLLTIGIILLICWALGLFAFHVTGSVIHLLIIIAVIAIVVHLLRGRSVM